MYDSPEERKDGDEKVSEEQPLMKDAKEELKYTDENQVSMNLMRCGRSKISLGVCDGHRYFANSVISFSSIAERNN